MMFIMSAFQTGNVQAAGAPWVGTTLWGTPCTGAGEGYGPFDYLLRSQYSKELILVESAHFTPNVENLISGSTGSLTADLGYTLRAWPNHHRALNSVVRLRVRMGSNFPRSGDPPAECYLQRAINYSRKDSTAQMLYAMLLHRMSQNEKALQYYQAAENLSPNDVQIKYNMGLLLCDMGRYQEAKSLANEVYAQGYPLPGLRRRLSAKGYD